MCWVGAVGAADRDVHRPSIGAVGNHQNEAGFFNTAGSDGMRCSAALSHLDNGRDVFIESVSDAVMASQASDAYLADVTEECRSVDWRHLQNGLT